MWLHASRDEDELRVLHTRPLRREAGLGDAQRGVRVRTDQLLVFAGEVAGRVEKGLRLSLIGAERIDADIRATVDGAVELGVFGRDREREVADVLRRELPVGVLVGNQVARERHHGRPRQVEPDREVGRASVEGIADLLERAAVPIAVVDGQRREPVAERQRVVAGGQPIRRPWDG